MVQDKVLEKRRDRSIAKILSFKEKKCDEFLPADISAELRKVILDEINDVCDLALSLNAQGEELNQLFLDKMAEYYPDKR